MKLSRIISAVTASLILLPSFPAAADTAAAAAPALPAANTEVRHAAVCTQLPESAAAYYTGEHGYAALSQLAGAADSSDSCAAMQNNALFDALHDLMTDTQTFTTEYAGFRAGALAYYWARTDCVAGNSDFVAFYSDVPYYYNSASDKAFNMEREHIWPKSKASFYQLGGGADLHHLRPSVSELNQAKSNYMFGNVREKYADQMQEVVIADQVQAYVCKSKEMFECKDDVKGDAARILLYVYCRYAQPNLYSDVDASRLPPLDSDDETYYGGRVAESLDTLLEWMQNDPVDTWEMQRNNLTAEVQGNRNVFIDYPELAWLMFGREIPADLQTPSCSGSAEPAEGDFNGDKAVTAADAVLLARFAAEDETLTQAQINGILDAKHDLDEDGLVTVTDVHVLIRILLQQSSDR